MSFRTVRLGGAQERHVVGLAEVFHQGWNELLGRKTLQAAVLRRHDHVKAARRIRNLVLSLQTAQSTANSRKCPTEASPSLRGREVVLAVGSELRDVLRCSQRLSNITLNDLLHKCRIRVARDSR
jgi:hypothetical protein